MTTLQLKSNSLNPLYLQLKQLILDDINRGKYQNGQQLPTEAELCERYGVSRITTRRAISDLVEEGILSRQQGKGTFVTNAKIKNELVKVGGFSEFSVETGKPHKSRVLSTSIIQADGNHADKLKVDVGDSLLRVERLLYVADDPLIIETTHYPCKRFPGFEKLIGESVSTYALLKDRYNTEPMSHEKLINVVFARKDEAELLDVDLGSTLYEVEKIAFDANDVPIHTSVLLLPTNKVTLSVQRVYKK